MRLFITSIGLVIFISFLSSCDQYPKDARNTLQKARNDTLKVGVAVNKGWVMVQNGRPKGREVELVQAFANELNAVIDWTVANETVLMPLLKKGEIYLVIGGFIKDSPWKKHVGFTKPYTKVNNKEHVLAIPPGENAFLMRLELFLNDYKKGDQ